MKNKILILVLCLLILSAFKINAHACSCGKFPFTDNYNMTDVIVFGKIINVEKRVTHEELPICKQARTDKYYRLESPNHSCHSPAWWKGDYYTVEVEQSWKLGNLKTIEVVIIPEDLCGMGFQVEKHYLIYLRQSKMGWSTGMCSGTHEAASKDIELAFLDAIESKSTTLETLRRMRDSLTHQQPIISASSPELSSIDTESEPILKALASQSNLWHERISLQLLQYLVGHNLSLEYLLLEKYRSILKTPPSLDQAKTKQIGMRNLLELALATSRMEEAQDIIYPGLLDQFASTTKKNDVFSMLALMEISSPHKVISRLREYRHQSSNHIVMKRAQDLLEYYRDYPKK